MSEYCYWANEHQYATCKPCLSIFTKIILLIINIVVFSVFICSSIIISAFVALTMSFIEVFAWLRICLLRNRFTVLLAGIKQNLLLYWSFNTSLLLTITFVQPCLLPTSSSFLLRLSEWHGKCNLGQNYQNFRSKNLKASVLLSTCALFYDKADCSTLFMMRNLNWNL